MKIGRIIRDLRVRAALALLAGAGALAAYAAWTLHAPPPGTELRTVEVAGRYDAVGACLERRLRDEPRLAGAARRPAVPAISTLARPEARSMRILFEGSAAMRFVLTVEERRPDLARASLLVIRPFDPAPLIESLVRACAGR